MNSILKSILSKHGNLSLTINNLENMVDSCNSSSVLLIYGAEKSLHALEKDSLIKKEDADTVSDKIYELGEKFRDNCNCR